MVKRNVTDEQFLEILDSLTAGKSLATICKAKHLPSSRTILDMYRMMKKPISDTALLGRSKLKCSRTK